MPNLSPIRTPMPKQEPAARSRNFSEAAKGYLPEQAMAEAARCLHCKEPRCRTGCPVSNRIPDFLAAAAAGDFAGAYAILRENTCMPAVCGRVCPHENQCEGHCVRGGKGEPVAIGAVERFVAEWAWKQGLRDTAPKKNGRCAAVVGAGPAGLACAQELARRGYGVTVYDAAHKAGGVLAWGIPSFRLPDGTVEAILAQTRALGVKFCMDTRIGEALSVDALFEAGAEAVFLGTGALVPNRMDVPGEELEGVILADRFLSAVNLAPVQPDGGRASAIPLGKNVLVFGGGNVAMDAARCAVRQKGVERVTIVYRRTEAEMPACRAELREAQEEGVAFQTLANAAEFLGENGRVTAARCFVMELGEPDESGRRRPVKKPGEFLTLAADSVILALGFSNDPLLGKATPGLEIDRWGAFLCKENGETSRPGVFAGGDAVTGAATVVEAMRAGLRAAKAMDEYLRGSK